MGIKLLTLKTPMNVSKLAGVCLLWHERFTFLFTLVYNFRQLGLMILDWFCEQIVVAKKLLVKHLFWGNLCRFCWVFYVTKATIKPTLHLKFTENILCSKCNVWFRTGKRKTNFPQILIKLILTLNKTCECSKGNAEHGWTYFTWSDV